MEAPALNLKDSYDMLTAYIRNMRILKDDNILSVSQENDLERCELAAGYLKQALECLKQPVENSTVSIGGLDFEYNSTNNYVYYGNQWTYLYTDDDGARYVLFKTNRRYIDISKSNM